MSIVFIFLLIENIVERAFPYLKYFDELLCVIFFIRILFWVLKDRTIKKQYFKIVLMLIFVIVIGSIGTYCYGFQLNNIAIFKDILAVSKFFITYIYAAMYFDHLNIDKQITLATHVINISKLFVTVVFVFSIANQFFDIGMDMGYRGDIKVFSFLYTHSTFLVAVLVVLSSIFISNGVKKNKIYLFMVAFILLTTMRMKAFVYIVCCFFVFLYFKNNKYITDKSLIRRKIKFFVMLLMVLTFSFLITKNKIMAYISWGLSAARPALYITSLKILSDCFPIGSGFATFASSISGEYSSPLYFLYGISNTSGLSAMDGYSYISDTYWPYIFAQYGIAGFVFYSLGLYFIYRNIKDKNMDNLDSLIASISLFLYVILGCFVESILTNASVILIALAMGLFIPIVKSKSKSI